MLRYMSKESANVEIQFMFRTFRKKAILLFVELVSQSTISSALDFGNFEVS